jgi:uncharacterized protein (UPF0305 family)
MELTIGYDDIAEDGTIDHIDVSNYTKIICRYCTTLKKLPLWTNITEVDCRCI